MFFGVVFKVYREFFPGLEVFMGNLRNYFVFILGFGWKKASKISANSISCNLGFSHFLLLSIEVMFGEFIGELMYF